MGVAPVFGDGSQELSVIYAGDLAAALVAAATTPATANRVYYAAHPVVTTSRDLVRAIGRAVGREPRIVPRSEEHTSELQSQSNLVCRLLLEKKKQR